MDPMPPPPPPPPPSVPPPPYGAEPLPNRTWIQRNRSWAIPVGCLLAAIFVPCCLGLGAIAYYGDRAVSFISNEKQRFEQVQAEVIRIVAEDPRVITAVGEPVQVGVAMTSYNNVNGVARVKFNLTASGPSGEANGRGEAVRADSEAPWDIGPLTIELEDGTVQLVEGAFTEDDAAGDPWPTRRRDGSRESGAPPPPPVPAPPPPGSTPPTQAPRPPDNDPFQE